MQEVRAELLYTNQNRRLDLMIWKTTAFSLSSFLTKRICRSVDDRPEPTQRRRHHRPSQCYLRGSLQRRGLSGSHRGQCQRSRQPRLVNIHILSALRPATESRWTLVLTLCPSGRRCIARPPATTVLSVSFW